jgi:CDP-diacylglycerol--glycerol-3-phosphate 3-phosphatidyltransferase
MKLNTPNKITLTRLILGIVMVLLYSLTFLPGEIVEKFAPEMGTSGFSWIDLVCACLFTAGSITDAVDGRIARSRNLITDFGKFADPLADKFLVDAALIMLCAKTDWYGHRMIYPIIVVVIVARDLAMDGLRMLANSKGKVLAANIYGKVKTGIEMGFIPVVFLNGFPFTYLNWKDWYNGKWEYAYIITNVAALVAMVMAVVSAIIYFKQNKDVFDTSK